MAFGLWAPNVTAAPDYWEVRVAEFSAMACNARLREFAGTGAAAGVIRMP